MRHVIKYEDILSKFDSSKWNSFAEFESYYLQRISERSLAGNTIYFDVNGNEIRIPQVDHFPEFKEYEIWESGCDEFDLQYIGTALARNFEQACHIVKCKQYLRSVEYELSTKKADYGRFTYNPDTLSDYWCELFWSEELAKKYSS